MFGASHSTAGVFGAGAVWNRVTGGAGNYNLHVQQASGDINFLTGLGAGTVQLTVQNAGTVKFGAASSSANGSVATVLGFCWPCYILTRRCRNGSRWLPASGTMRYIPMF